MNQPLNLASPVVHLFDYLPGALMIGLEEFSRVHGFGAAGTVYHVRDLFHRDSNAVWFGDGAVMHFHLMQMLFNEALIARPAQQHGGRHSSFKQRVQDMAADETGCSCQ